MAAIQDRKLFAGTRIRRLRRELGLTQARMADDIGISTSYLNLLERNQRPLSAQLLVRLNDVFDIDIKDFSGDEDSRIVASLREVLADPLFLDTTVGASELIDLVGASPATANALITLYRAYRDNTATVVAMTERIEAGEAADADKAVSSHHVPIDEVREFFQDNNNHFAELENAAETLRQEGPFSQTELYDGLRDHLKATHDISVRIAPGHVLEDSIWRLDRHSRRLFIVESVDLPGRTFIVANQLGLLGHRDLIDGIITRSGLAEGDAAQLCRLGLANYFAGALIMPYERFLETAESERYDLDTLAARFGASVQQVCHRLTTLQRAGARGVPLFFVRIDDAGNISKRYSAAGFHFARFGGSCPRWNLHRAFAIPGEILSEVVETEAGDRFFTFGRTVPGYGDGHRIIPHRHAIGMGCRLEFAHKLAYADGRVLGAEAPATPIGVNCRVCERPLCSYRAQPPLGRQVSIGEHQRSVSPFSFEGW